MMSVQCMNGHNDPVALAARHPELAETLRWYLRNLDFVQHAATELASSDDRRSIDDQVLDELGDL